MIGKVVNWVIANLGYLSLLAIALMIIGGFLRIPALFMVGAGLFLALLTVLLLKIIFSFLYEIIPEFRNKTVVMIILLIVLGGFILGYLAGWF